MKTVRFYDMIMDTVENGVETSRQLDVEFRLDLPEDFDLNDAFPMLCEKTGHDVCSFRYEFIGE